MSSVLKKARLNEANGRTMSSIAGAASSRVPTNEGTVTPAIGMTAGGNHDFAALASRVRALRELLHQRGVSAYMVETQDGHQSEYVSDHDMRRAWLTGFTGSAGTALVTMTKALLWTDGRYFLQVRVEKCESLIQMSHGGWTCARIVGLSNLRKKRFFSG